MLDKHQGSGLQLEEVYVIMHLSEVFESGYYINKEKVSERVENLNADTDGERFWYKTLFKVGV